jgi:hypothetical protein
MVRFDQKRTGENTHLYILDDTAFPSPGRTILIQEKAAEYVQQTSWAALTALPSKVSLVATLQGLYWSTSHMPKTRQKHMKKDVIGERIIRRSS